MPQLVTLRDDHGVVSGSVSGGKVQRSPARTGTCLGSFIRSVASLRVQCVSSSPVPSAGEAAVAVVLERAAVLHRVSGGSVVECFAAIADPRQPQGIRHSLASILGMCTAAALTGQVLLTDIADWIRHADQEILAGLECRRGAHGRCTPPHPDTVGRVFTLLGAQGLADGVGAYLAGKTGIGCGRPGRRPGAVTGDRGERQSGARRDRRGRADPLSAGRAVTTHGQPSLPD